MNEEKYTLIKRASRNLLEGVKMVMHFQCPRFYSVSDKEADKKDEDFRNYDD